MVLARIVPIKCDPDGVVGFWCPGCGNGVALKPCLEKFSLICPECGLELYRADHALFVMRPVLDAG